MALPVPDESLDYPALVLSAKDRIPGMTVEGAFEMFGAVAPEGWRVELVEGDIHVSPPSDGEHAEIVAGLTGQMWDHDRSLRCYTRLGLLLPERAVSGRVQPDLVLAPKGSFADQAEYHDPSPVLLVAEVTSRSTAGNDRVKKIRGYARAGIPVYLLIDRATEQAVVCTEPSGEDYGTKAAYKLGEVVPLPAPLGFALDTGAF
ncbi:Uma2 family endonuclease [Streptomyces sp. NPDC015131]|uniref:Uma2 family endonuclease n=1 Tax=Streptomyces sp. NPDC015131 TaxID=3364941 RepID=UPI0036F5FA98